MRNSVIKLINSGISLKEISEQLNINYNTVRQISYSLNLLNKFNYLNNDQIKKLQSIGNNIKALGPIKDNKEAIITVVDYINESTTRKEIEEIVANINDVQKRKELLIERYNTEIMRIEYDIEILKNRITEITDINKFKEKLNEEFKYIRQITDRNIRNGYLNLIGLKCVDNKIFYSLNKRVSLNLWNRLRREEAINPRYNEIINMNKFVKLTINSIKRNNYYKNSEKEPYSIQIKHLTVDKQIDPLIAGINTEISEYIERINKLNESILLSSKDAIQNYFEEREFKNRFTKKDSITHAKIQQGGAKWLYNNGYVSTIELSKDNCKFDVIGYNNVEVVILEAKASISDLKSDKKINNYMKYCDKLYMVSNSESVCNVALDYLDTRIGIVRLNKSFGFNDILREATNINNANENILVDINRKNSRQLLFGR